MYTDIAPNALSSKLDKRCSHYPLNKPTISSIRPPVNIQWTRFTFFGRRWLVWIRRTE